MKNQLAGAAYGLLWLLLIPLAVTWFLITKPPFRAHLCERFGLYGSARQPDDRPLIWLHAVSVGETRAAQPLVRQLTKLYPQYQLLVTNGTPTGRQTNRELFDHKGVLRGYLPFDHPWFMRRFMSHYKPVVGVIMETELWPAMTRCARQLQIPLVLANGRLSDRSLHRWLRWPVIFKPALASLDRVLVQTERHAARMRRAGRNDVIVTGNLKFDAPVPPDLIALGKSWRQQVSSPAVVMLASSRDGEEQRFLDAWCGQDRADNCVVIIVPRHPERFDQVYELMQNTGLRCARRSELNQSSVLKTDLLLGDSMGEMYAYYAAADFVVMGGSLLPFGGQNLIEPCASARGVIIGANTFNFEDVSEQAVAAGAAIRVNGPEDAAEMTAALMKQPDRVKTMSQVALHFASSHRGATARTLEVISEYLN